SRPGAFAATASGSRHPPAQPPGREPTRACRGRGRLGPADSCPAPGPDGPRSVGRAGASVFLVPLPGGGLPPPQRLSRLQRGGLPPRLRLCRQRPDLRLLLVASPMSPNRGQKQQSIPRPPGGLRSPAAVSPISPAALG